MRRAISVRALGGRSLFILLILGGALLTAVPVGAQTVRPAAVEQMAALNVPLNKSQVIETDRNFTNVSLGNPEIADVVALSRRSLYIFGKTLGSTSLTLSDAQGRIMAVVDISITHDIEGFKAKLYEVMPNEAVEVRSANGGLVVSGQVSTAAQVARVMAIAERFAPESVSNLMTVAENQQVMLAVRFAEMERRLIRDLGFSNDLAFEAGDFIGGGRSGEIELDPFPFASPVVGLLSGNFSLTTIIDVLEEKGVVKTLAEPNLIALSGDTANFLAGGEFPIPAGRRVNPLTGAVEIVIEFKQFGVSLSFTPTVLGNGLMNLELLTEVSEIDEETSILLEDLLIPGLQVRRAKTTVELRNGQSFAIAGLLQENLRNDVRQIPVLGDLPVLGALFRSAGFESGQTELAVIVTPYLVKPSTLAKLRTPDQNFVPPTDAELFGLGRVEGAPSEDSAALGRDQAAGIVGAYGYILQ